MLVRLLCDRCGPYHGMQYDGEVVDLPEKEARRLIFAGQAELAPDPVQTATKAPPSRNAMRSHPATNKRD